MYLCLPVNVHIVIISYSPPELSKSLVGSFSVTGRLALSLIMGSVGPFPVTGRKMRPDTDEIPTEHFEITARDINL